MWNSPHGWDLLWHDQVITSGRKQRYTLTEIQFYVWGKMCAHSEANEMWKSQILDFERYNSYRELCGIDGEPSEVEWNIIPGLTPLEIFQRSTRIWMIDNKSRTLWRANHLHVNVQWHWWDKEKKFFGPYFDFPGGTWLCKKISAMTLVIPLSRRRRWVVWIVYLHNRRAPSRLTSSFFLLTWFVRFRAHCHLRFKKTERENVTKMPILWLNTLKKVDTQYSEVSVAFNRGILKERRKIYDSLFCGIFECKAITSHNPLGKSAQYVRSSIEFVWRLRWKDFWSNIFACGQIYFKRERSAFVQSWIRKKWILCNASWLRSPHGLCSLREGCRTCEEGVPVLGVIQVRCDVRHCAMKCECCGKDTNNVLRDFLSHAWCVKSVTR